jgi:radical SAM superfamily enzyme YgiQ (UPF0313 family)
MPEKEQLEFLSKESILRVPSFSMPIGLIDLAAYLREYVASLRIQILDIGKDLYKIYLARDTTEPMTIEQFLDAELDKVDFVPDIVGISIMFSSSHKSSLKIIDVVMKRWPGVLTICGGNHATNHYRNLLGTGRFDYIFRGEAEQSLVEFIKELNEGKEASDVVGVVSRDCIEEGNPKIGSMIEDLDAIPMPAYDLLDIELYRSTKTVGASLMVSRGCFFKCAFCAAHTVHGRKVRFKGNDRIIDELKYLVQDCGFSSITIEDDLFAANKEKFLYLADKIKNLKYSVKYYLPQGLSVAMLDKEVIDKMVEIGIDEASVAIESGSKFTQKKIIKKNVPLQKARRVLGYLRQKDFFLYVNFILGFPGETRELMGESIEYMKELDTDWVFIFHAIPLPGSEIYDVLVANGQINPDTFDWDSVRLGKRSFDTPEITAEELETLVYDTNIEVNFFNNANMRERRYKKAIDVFQRIILDLYPFHIVGLYCRALCYRGLDRAEEAEKDFIGCVEWIGKNDESRRLYNRYCNRMDQLKPYMGRSSVD